MVMILYIIGAFAVIGAVIAFICVMQGTDFSEFLPVYSPTKKKVGATFWGHYADESAIDAPETEIIALPKITYEYEGLAGGTTYAKGRPIKSARVK